MGNAGRVLMIPKGEYNSATTYEMLDFVYYQGRSYVCKQTSTGNAPTNTTYWQALTGDASAEIQALTNYVADTGVKNFLKPYYASGYTETIGTTGTFTANSDGSVTIASDSAVTAVDFKLSSGQRYPAGTYIISGIPAGASAQTFGLWYAIWNADHTNYYKQEYIYEDTIITLPYDTEITLYLEVTAGYTIGSKTYYPMIRDASIADDTYQPYAKTNLELTQESAVQTATWKDSTTNFDFIVTKKNGICILCNTSGNGSVVSSGAPVEVGTIPTGFRPSTETRSMGIFGDSAVFAVIATTGGSLRFGTWSEKTISNAFFEIVYPCAD